MSEEPKIGHPHATRESYGELVPVPNSNASEAHQLFVPRKYKRIARNSGEYVHAKHDQEGSGSKGHVCRELKNMRRQGTNKRSFLRQEELVDMPTSWRTLSTWGVITCQGADVHMTDSSDDIPDS